MMTMEHQQRQAEGGSSSNIDGSAGDGDASSGGSFFKTDSGGGEST